LTNGRKSAKIKKGDKDENRNKIHKANSKIIRR